MQVRFSFSFCSEEGEKFFGEGPYRLLCGIRRAGSLRSAAQEMDMAYTKAFRLIKSAEAQLGFPLIRRTIGGKAGGGSTLTAEAEDLIARYEAFKADCSKVTAQLYERHFGDFPPQCAQSEVEPWG